MAIKNVFQNGDLEEKIYMQQLEGFVASGEHKVCRLNKVLHGLK